MRKRYWAAIAVAAAVGMLSDGTPVAQTLGQNIAANAAKEAGEKTEENSALEVTMSKTSGCYDTAFSLEFTCANAEKIYYTTDGSNPVTSSTRKEYTGAVLVQDRAGEANVLAAVEPVLFDSAYATYKNKVMGDKYSAPRDSEVDKATIIKAVGVNDKGEFGNVVTNTYFVGAISEHIKGIKESCQAAGMPLSIMSISMEYDDLFDYEKGIYVKGKLFDEAFASYPDSISSWNIADVSRKLNANYKQKGKEWERAAHVDYLESDGVTTECKLQQDCGIRVQGNYSRSDLQKGLRLFARADYGKKNFKYPFFGEASRDSMGNVVNKFKKLTLRNGGNGAFLAKYNDAYWQSLLRDTACETLSSRVCAVYLNGEYWGIYILQEDYGDDYFADKYGVNKDAVVMYKGDAEAYDTGYTLDDGTLPEGVTDEGYFFRDLMEFFEKHTDLKAENDYQEFAKLVDVDSVMDFFAAQIWVNNKWDWPGKNWSMWKSTETDISNPYADGRWRLCLYDLDFGGWSGSGEAYTNTIKDDNYKPYGLLDMDTDNPTVLCFAYLMTNEGFRGKFADRLQEMTVKNFEAKQAVAVCDNYRDTYQPLYQQFFTRFFGQKEGEKLMNNTLWGAGSHQAMVDYVNERPKYIANILKWVDTFYKTHTIYNSELAAEEDTDIDTPKSYSIKLTAKRGKKSITVKTIKKAKVTVSLSDKIMYSGGKKVKKLTVLPAGNKNGTIKIKLSSKLKKGMKITVKVYKNGSVSQKVKKI